MATWSLGSPNQTARATPIDFRSGDQRAAYTPYGRPSGQWLECQETTSRQCVPVAPNHDHIASTSTCRPSSLGPHNDDRRSTDSSAGLIDPGWRSSRPGPKTCRKLGLQPVPTAPSELLRLAPRSPRPRRCSPRTRRLSRTSRRPTGKTVSPRRLQRHARHSNHVTGLPMRTNRLAKERDHGDQASQQSSLALLVKFRSPPPSAFIT